MTNKNAVVVSKSKHLQDLRPEYVAMGLLAEGEAHGYELYRRFRLSLNDIWHMSESQFYATLRRMESHGLIVASAPEKGEGAAKRLLSLTPDGRQVLFKWIEEPTAGSPRLLHLEFLTRIYFARRLMPQDLNHIIDDQSALLATDIERLEKQQKDNAPESGDPMRDLGNLSSDFRIRQLRTALLWIEESIKPTWTDADKRARH
ncbi:MAG: PadR family transcriptional regulator [Spirochaetaceae bacterium]|nr:PadR family transcriptional regulator [Spirochaetaceae bacterium]